MVSLNKQTDFGFPFANAKKEKVSNFPKKSIPSKFDSTDIYLSAIAFSFFFAILLMISLDGKVSFNISPTNSMVNQNSQQLAFAAPINFETQKSITPKVVVDKKVSSKIVQSEFVQPKIVQPKKVKSPKDSKSKITKSIIVKSTPATRPVLITPKKEIIKSAVIVKTKPAVKKEIPLPTIEQTYLNQSTKKVSFPTNQKSIVAKLVPTKVVTAPIAKNVAITKKAIEKPIEKSNTLIINDEIPVDALPVSYFAAKTKAEIEGKMLIIKFGAKWCLPCREMNNTTFKNEKVKDYLKKNFVSLNIDVQDFDGVNMQSYFNVKMLPTMLFFNSTGKFIGQYVEYISSNEMIEILEKHTSEEKITEPSTLTPFENIIIQEEKVIKKTPTIVFNHINLQKTKTGKPITSLNSKAKNWRFTNVDFSTKYISEGDLLLKVKEIQSGKLLSQVFVPWNNSNLGITDSTTNFQLEIPHKKRKKKKGNYVLEIFHVTPTSTILIGKKQLIENGIILN